MKNFIVLLILSSLFFQLSIADSKTPPVNQPIKNKVNRGYTDMPKDLLTDRVVLGGGYRQYSPVLRGFTKHDSASPIGKGGINAYNYVHNNPINAVDPTGHVYEPLEYTITPGFNDTNFSRLGSSTWDVIGEVSDIEQDFEDALDILDMVFGSGIEGAEDLISNLTAVKASEDLGRSVSERSVQIAHLKTFQMLNIKKDDAFFKRLMAKKDLKSLVKQSPPEVTLALFMKGEKEADPWINFPCCTHSAILQSMYYSGQEYSMAQIAAVISSGDGSIKAGFGFASGNRLSTNTVDNISNILDMLSNHTAHSNFHDAFAQELSGPIYSQNHLIAQAFEKYAKPTTKYMKNMLIFGMPGHETFLYRQALDDNMIISEIKYDSGLPSLTEKTLTKITKEDQYDDLISLSGNDMLSNSFYHAYSFSIGNNPSYFDDLESNILDQRIKLLKNKLAQQREEMM